MLFLLYIIFWAMINFINEMSQRSDNKNHCTKWPYLFAIAKNSWNSSGDLSLDPPASESSKKHV